MRIEPADTNNKISDFFLIESIIYKDNKSYRPGDADILELMVKGTTKFLNHSVCKPFVVYSEDKPVGRFVLVNDDNMQEVVQISFFEILYGFNPSKEIEKIVVQLFPKSKKIVAGLNGHLNYGAGFLNNRFDEVPVFGLTYSNEYYHDVFSGYLKKKAFSFRFPIQNPVETFGEFVKKIQSKGYSVRTIKKKNFKEEVKIYTDLNNKAFVNHSYWTNRDYQEDWELYNPFRNMLKEENILIAEYNSMPVGFLLWFPDYNQLITKQRKLRVKYKLSEDVLRLNFCRAIDTIRLAEIAVIPGFQSRGIELLLLFEMMKTAHKRKFKFGEGGFILEDNSDSFNMAFRFIKRITGKDVKPYREFIIYEKDL